MPIKVAVILDQKIKVGGGYQQSINAALLASHLPKELATISYYTIIKEDINNLNSYGMNVKLLRLNLINRLLLRIEANQRYLLLKYFLNTFLKFDFLERILAKDKIDLVYFLSPTKLALFLDKTNYIYTVWDLCHRDHPEFPEVRNENQFEIREANYSKILPKATAVIVDAEISKKNIINRYKLDSHRIFIFPFEAGHKSKTKNNINKISIIKRLKLNSPYIFYPAQFWPHKNHIYILKALKYMETNYSLKMHAVFCGSDQGNLKYIKKCVEEMELNNRIHFTGFISDLEIKELYLNTLALVMPSYFGPTNLPPLEAFELGVPVVYSDMPGMKDQVGNAALLINLDEPESLAFNLKMLLENPELSNDLINKGYEKFSNYNKEIAVNNLIYIIKSFKAKRACWE